MHLTFRIFLLLCALPIFIGVGDAQVNPEAKPDSTLSALKALGSDSVRISSLLNYARTLEDIHPSEAIAIERNAVAGAQLLHLDALQLRGAMRLGRLYFKNADYTRALQYFMQGQKMAYGLQRRMDEIDALKGISIIYMRTHDLPKSQRYLKIADSIARRYGITERLPDLLSEMGIRYAEAHQYDSAVARYREAIAMARRLKQDDDELNALVNMAISLKSLRRFSEALAIYRDMLQRTQADGETQAIICENIANLYFESGNPAQSRLYALRALAISDTLFRSRNYIQQDIYTLLVKLYEQQGDYPKAFIASQQLSALKDSLFNEQNAKQLQEASVRFDTELKDSQIAAQQAQINYRNRLAYFLAGGILLLLIAGIITYVNQQKVRLLNRQVIAQKAQLEQMNGVKDRIFSAISHDIRTPLSSLFSFSRLLSEDNIPPEKLPLYTTQLNGQLSYTMGMMDNLLHWARSQMQGFHPVPETLDINAAATEAVQNAASEATQKNITVMKAIPQEIFAAADRQMLALILRNLIHNAIKYTPKGGSITLSAERTLDELQLSVQDNGIGIDAAAVAAFNTQEPMQSRPGTSGEKGTGLGLLLCKSLAAVMGGRIELESVKNEGSRFVLVLPA